MVCSMALYSSSPPTAHCALEAAAGAECHISSGKPSRGGLSCLFSSARHSAGPIGGDAMEPASCLSSSGVMRNSAQADVLWEAAESRPGSINIPGSRGKDRGSSVSMFHSSYGMSYSLDTQWRRASPECRAAGFRREGLEVNRYSRTETKATVLCGQVETFEDRKGESLTDLFVQNGRLSPVDTVFVGFEFSDLTTSPTDPYVHHSRKEISSDELLADAQERHKMFHDPFIIKAFRLADDAHRGHFRRSRDPYITHCVETAVLLALAGAEATVVAAGLLHDTLDDSNMDEAQLRANFGDDVTDLVVGVSKISQLSQLARDNNIASKTLEADRLRTMFLAMVDVRVVLIKLADRLHNMRTLGALPEDKQRRIADETLEILVPIANRLGIWSWKAEMEDLCFKYLKPVEYQELATKLAECCRRGVVMSAIEKLDKALRSSNVQFDDLCGRSKNLFSIYTKMKKKGRSIHEIYDVRGLRIIVEKERDCYAALEAVHKLWEHVPGKLKDYIKQPKANGYQSLHTVVLGEDRLPLEVQIRTKAMHRHAEFGMAAHWRYKEGEEKHSSFVLERVEWARWILTWHSEIMDTKLRVSPSQIDLRSSCPFPFHNEDCPHAQVESGPPEREDDPLFVIMLKGEKMLVHELPSGSTAGDLVQQRETNKTPLVNHQAVADVEQKLRMGDVVEIVQENSSSNSGKVYVSMARVDNSNSSNSTSGTTSSSSKMNSEITAYREQIRRMYGDGSCKFDARKDFVEMVNKESSQIAGLT